MADLVANAAFALMIIAQDGTTRVIGDFYPEREQCVKYAMQIFHNKSELTNTGEKVFCVSGLYIRRQNQLVWPQPPAELNARD